MRHLFVLCVILCGLSYSLTSENNESNGTFGENVDGVELLRLGRKLHKPMLTLIGMAIRNLHQCGEWTPWSSCVASRRGYFGSQTRSRSCAKLDVSDEIVTTTSMDNRICEGACPVSYNLTNNGFCMKLNTAKVSNDEAMKQCNLEGGHLINIDSQKKLDDVKSVISGYSSNIHIDGRRKDLPSPWKYQYGSQITFLTWYSGYPQNQSGNLCLALNYIKLWQYDHKCSVSFGFVCEVPKTQ